MCTRTTHRKLDPLYAVLALGAPLACLLRAGVPAVYRDAFRCTRGNFHARNLSTSLEAGAPAPGCLQHGGLSLCRTGLVLPQRREGQCSALGGATRLHLPSRPVLHSMQNDCWLPWQQRASNPVPSKVMVAVRECVHAGAYLALVVAADRVQIIRLPTGKPLQPFQVSLATSIRRCLSRRNVSRYRAWSLIVACMNTCHRRMFWCCRHRRLGYACSLSRLPRRFRWFSSRPIQSHSPLSSITKCRSSRFLELMAESRVLPSPIGQWVGPTAAGRKLAGARRCGECRPDVGSLR